MKLHSNIYGWEYVWEEFAEECKGKVIKDGQDSEAQIVAIQFPVAEHGSTFSITNSGHGTEFVASYAPSDEFMMRLFVETAVHKVEKIFGLQDIKIGDKQFDNHFVIQSNAPDRLTEVFSDVALREAILAEQIAEIRVFPNASRLDQRWCVPENHNIIVCTHNVFIDKYERLESNFKLMKHILGQFRAAGVLYHGAYQQGVPEQPARETPAGGRLRSPLLGR